MTGQLVSTSHVSIRLSNSHDFIQRLHTGTLNSLISTPENCLSPLVDGEVIYLVFSTGESPAMSELGPAMSSLESGHVKSCNWCVRDLIRVYLVALELLRQLAMCEHEELRRSLFCRENCAYGTGKLVSKLRFQVVLNCNFEAFNHRDTEQEEIP